MSKKKSAESSSAPEPKPERRARKKTMTESELRLEHVELMALVSTFKKLLEEMKSTSLASITVDGEVEYQRGKKKVRAFIANVSREIYVSGAQPRTTVDR